MMLTMMAQKRYLALPAYRGEMEREDMRLLRVMSCEARGQVETPEAVEPAGEARDAEEPAPTQAGSDETALPGRLLGQFLLPIGDEVGEPDWYAFLPIEKEGGRLIRIEIDGGESYTQWIYQTDEQELTANVPLRSERPAGRRASPDITVKSPPAGRTGTVPVGKGGRPSLHYTPPYGWLNDPNGLICVDGVYHLFHQHNPVGTMWGNMSWGHAVSRDLLHYEWVGEALLPDEHGVMYSGCAIRNASGAFGLPEHAILYFYTTCNDDSRLGMGAPDEQRLAYSLDGGRTLTKVEDWCIPMTDKGNRDPKVFRHEASNAWIMTLYLADARFAILRSEDLEHWTVTQTLDEPPMWECPDLVPLRRETADAPDCAGATPAGQEAGADSGAGTGRSDSPAADAGELPEKWAFLSADGFYYIGSFDGFTFTKETPMQTLYGGERPWLPYAAQTWSDAGGRVMATAWLRIPNRGEIYTGAASLPREFTLGEYTEQAGGDEGATDAAPEPAGIDGSKAPRYYIRQRFAAEVTPYVTIDPDGSQRVDDAYIRETISPDGRYCTVEVI